MQVKSRESQKGQNLHKQKLLLPAENAAPEVTPRQLSSWRHTLSACQILYNL